jgi:hypothetical protein
MWRLTSDEDKGLGPLALPLRLVGWDVLSAVMAPAAIGTAKPLAVPGRKRRRSPTDI